MIAETSPFHATYHRMMGKVYRLNCEVVGTNEYAAEVPLKPGTLVEVLDAVQTSEPEYGQIRKSNYTYTGVTDDCVRLVVRTLTSTGRVHFPLTADSVVRSMLDPEPGVVTWPREFSRRAITQGWEIFYCDGSDGPLYQIQAVTDEDRFASDEKAWEFVWRKATDEEDPVCLAALAFVRHRCPREYNAVRKHCLGSREV